MAEHPLLVAIGIVSTVGGAAGAFALLKPVSEELRWRSAESDKISELRVGLSSTRLDEILGSPTNVSELEEDMSRLLYAERGYWVAAAINEEDAVASYVVHICDRELRPTMTTPYLTVTLNDSTLADVSPQHPEVAYWWMADEPPSFFETTGGSRSEADVFTTYGVGQACAGEWRGREGEGPALLECEGVGESARCLEFDDGEDMLASELQEFHEVRQNLIVNTFGQTDGTITVPGVAVTAQEVRRFE